MWWIYKLEPPVKQRTSREEENELETASIKGDHMVATARRNQVVTNLWKTNSMLLSLIFFHHNICWDSKLVFDDYSSKLKDVLFASLYVVYKRNNEWESTCTAMAMAPFFAAMSCRRDIDWISERLVHIGHLISLRLACTLVCTFSTRSWNEQERSH